MELGDSVNSLKQFLHIKKEILGLRQLKEEPSHVKAYQDKNNICYMMGEVLELEAIGLYLLNVIKIISL